MQKSNSFLTIDPGSNIGGALFCNAKPLFTFVILDDKKGNWDERGFRTIYNFRSELLAPRQFAETCYIERPIFFGGTEKGLYAANSDALYKLTTIYGQIVQSLHDFGFIIKYLKPYEWKGQLNKKQLADRLKRLTGKKYPDHIADAIGIGYYILGQFPYVRAKSNKFDR